MKNRFHVPKRDERAPRQVLQREGKMECGEGVSLESVGCEFSTDPFSGGEHGGAFH